MGNKRRPSSHGVAGHHDHVSSPVRKVPKTSPATNSREVRVILVTRSVVRVASS